LNYTRIMVLVSGMGFEIKSHG